MRCVKTFLNAVLLCCLAHAMIGCSGGTVTVKQWQAEVDRYVWTEGNGDLNVLRDTESRSGRRVLAVHGGDNPASSTDVVGVLLGHAILEGHPSQVFLVGTVAKGVPQDIRVAALSRNGRDLVWRIGEPDSKAMSKYREARAKPAAPGKPDPKQPLWPGKHDAFTLHVTPQAVTVLEQRSGASWQLTTGG